MSPPDDRQQSAPSDPVGRDAHPRPESVEEAQARLAAIVESSDDAIVSKSLDGVIRTWNAGAERLFGYTAAEAVGRAITLIIPPERLAEEQSILERLFRGERITSFETVRVAKDGRRLDISLTVSPVRDARGHVIGASKVARDITEHKRVTRALERTLEREREQARTFRQVADASLAIHAAGSLERVLAVLAEEARRILGADRAFASLTTSAELSQSSVTAALADGLPGRERPPPPAELVREVCRANRTVRRADVPGLRGWLAAPLVGRGGDNLGIVHLCDKHHGSFDDNDEAVLSQLAHITSIAVENNNLNATLRDQDRRKDEFLALLAHELRNPLAPLRNGLQVLRLSDDPPVRRRAQGMMDRQLDHMVRLIDDLLDIARINRQKLELRRARVLLADVVHAAVETARPLVDAAGHHLEVVLPGEPVVLDADLTRLAQVISNLLTNSAKYTDPGGHIRLSAELQGDGVRVVVRDDGLGIPRASLASIFEMFSQVDRTLERARGGLGIGLALVKGLVEMHGGSITADSQGDDRGSTFTVVLPLAPRPPDEPSQAADHGARPVSGRRILVVDDNRDAALTMAAMLELNGDETQVAFDGLEALAAAERFRPQAILMDMGMPGLNGYDATRRIREQPWGRAIAIVALTGWGQAHDRARSRAAGCDGHLVKPAGFDDLDRLLTDLLDARA
ncbi:MAG: PAS domain S-box protein [Myxococcales bacterium]|nr:PAS domain S-box protein [Myxococcales bacterium]